MCSDARRSSTARSVSAALFCVAILLGCGLFANAQNTIYTVAGGGNWNGTALGPSADLASPSAVAKDSLGNTYVVVPAAHNVFKIDTSGNLTVFAGLGYPTEHAPNYNGKPATQASLNSPLGVAVDTKGNVFIADTVNYMIRKVSTAGVISTVAGNFKLCQDSTTACGDNAVATAAQLNYPTGMAADANGNLYIADTGNNKIRVVNLSTATITVAGISIPSKFIVTVAGDGNPCASSTAACGDLGPGIKAQLNSPQGVAVDSTGNIYIADAGDRRIRVVNSSGMITNYAGNGTPCNPATGCGNNGLATAASISNPWQLAVDASGDLFVADSPVNMIREINGSTKVITTVAGTGRAGFAGDGGLATKATLNHTRGVAVDSLGNIVIADLGNQRVRTFTVGGNISTVAGGGSGNDGSVATSGILGGDRGVALDGAGNLYIADSYNNRIRKVTPSTPPATIGSITTIAGTGIAGFAGDGGVATSAGLNFPADVAVDSSNNVYVSDTSNLVIRKFSAGGNIAVIAGTAGAVCTVHPCGDGGPALSAHFAMPTSIALDSSGNVYVADTALHSIRVINTGSSTIVVANVSIAAGNIATVAGDGTPCGNPLPPQCGDNGPSTSAQLNSPFGVAVDATGNIFIADTNDNRIREVLTTGVIINYAFKGTTNFGPLNVVATNASYSTPHYLAIDPRGNLYVSGSSVFSVVVRINALNKLAIAIAGVPTNPKFYGYAGDGGLATLSAINNSGLAVDGSGHLYIADDGNNRVREVLLTPAATLSVTSLSFPTQQVGTTSAVQSFKLTNTGSDDLFLSSVTFAAPFNLHGTTCPTDVIPAGSGCTFNVTFHPTTIGPANGSIVISDNAFGSPSQTVTLSGTGH
jgi:sugar lactone lactonase YvrE